MKTCKICGKPFKPNSNKQLCCSKDCSKINNRNLCRNRYHGFIKSKQNLDSLTEKLVRYEKLGLSYGYGVAMDHPEWAELTI